MKRLFSSVLNSEAREDCSFSSLPSCKMQHDVCTLHLKHNMVQFIAILENCTLQFVLSERRLEPKLYLQTRPASSQSMERTEDLCTRYQQSMNCTLEIGAILWCNYTEGMKCNLFCDSLHVKSSSIHAQPSKAKIQVNLTMLPFVFIPNNWFDDLNSYLQLLQQLLSYRSFSFHWSPYVNNVQGQTSCIPKDLQRRISVICKSESLVRLSELWEICRFYARLLCAPKTWLQSEWEFKQYQNLTQNFWSHISLRHHWT